jgi:hypothetical protein
VSVRFAWVCARGRGTIRRVTSSSVGQSCGNCYGEGQVPTDAGPVACPDCGGAGVLPTNNVLVEWRAAAIERAHGSGQGQDAQIAQDVRWLAFELRRARLALTKMLALAEELGEDAAAQQLRFIANEALGLYPIADAAALRAKSSSSSR